MTLPLAGCRVIDFTRALAGPFCTMVLGDLGADVIKVEALPDGDMTRQWDPHHRNVSVYFLSCNRNKRSLAINLRNPDGLRLARELAGGADIVVENFRPGAADAMGIGYEALASHNPRLIHASISGFGRGGPYEDWPGFDQIAQGMSGLMSVTGNDHSGPLRVGISIGDLTAGMWAAIGVLAAVNERNRTGIGQRVETSLLTGLVSLLGVSGQRYLTLGDVPKGTGNDHPVIAPYGVFHAADGPISIGCATESMWRALCKVLGAEALLNDTAFVGNSARVARRFELRDRLNDFLARRSKEEWTRLLVEAGIPAGPIMTLDEVFADPHVRGAGCIDLFDHPQWGQVHQLASPLRFDGLVPAGARMAPPALGEHSRVVLAESGISIDDIDHFIACGVVA